MDAVLASFWSREKVFYYATLESLTEPHALPAPFVASHGDGFHRHFAFVRALGGADQVTFGPQYDKHGKQKYDLYWMRREEHVDAENRHFFTAAGDGWNDFLRQYAVAIGDTVLMELVSPEIIQVHVFPRDLPYHDI